MARIDIDLGFNIDSKNLNRGIGEIQKRLDELNKRGSINGVKLDATQLKQYQTQLTTLYRTITELQAKQGYGVANASSWQNVEREATAFNNLNRSISATTQTSTQFAQAAIQNQAKLNTSFQTTKTTITDTISVSDKLIDNFKKIANWSISAIAFRAISSQLSEATGYARELDQSLTAIRTVTGKSFKEAQEMSREYNEMAQNLSRSTTEIANASVEFYRQGRNEKETQSLVEATTKASSVSGENMENTASMLTAALNGFQMTSEAAESVVDKFASLDAAMATSFKEMSYALTKVASSAHNAGISIDEMLGMIGTVSEITREAPENIGTSFKTIIARMRGTTDEGFIDDSSIQILNKVDEALASIGIRQREWSGELRSSFDVLDELGDKWLTLDKQTQSYLATQISGSRQQSRFFAMMDNWDRVSEAIQISENSLGKANEQFERYQQGLQAAEAETKAMKEELQNIIIDPSQMIAFNRVLQTIIKTLSKFFTAMKPMTLAIMLMSKVIGTSLFNGVRKITNELDLQTTKWRANSTAANKFAEDGASFLKKFAKAIGGISDEIDTTEKKMLHLFSDNGKYESEIVKDIKMRTITDETTGKTFAEQDIYTRDNRLSNKQRNVLSEKDKELYDKSIKQLEEAKAGLQGLLQLDKERVQANSVLQQINAAGKMARVEEIAANKQKLVDLNNEQLYLKNIITTLQQKQAAGHLESAEQTELNNALARQLIVEQEISRENQKQLTYTDQEKSMEQQVATAKSRVLTIARELNIQEINANMSLDEMVQTMQRLGAMTRGQADAMRQMGVESAKTVNKLKDVANKGLMTQQIFQGATQMALGGVQYAVSNASATTQYEKDTARNQGFSSIGGGAGAIAGAAIGSAFPVIGTVVGGMVGGMIGPIIGSVAQIFTEESRKALANMQKRVEEFKSNIEKNKANIINVNQMDNLDYYLNKVDKDSAGNLKNISLTNDEYNQFIQYNNQLATMFPELVAGYDDQGNAVMDLTMKLDVYKQKLIEIRNEQKQMYGAEYVQVIENAQTELINKQEEKDYKKAAEALEKAQKEYQANPMDVDLQRKFKEAEIRMKSFNLQLKGLKDEIKNAYITAFALTDNFENLTEQQSNFAETFLKNVNWSEFESDIVGGNEFITQFADAYGKNAKEIIEIKSKIDNLNKNSEGMSTNQKLNMLIKYRDEMLALMNVEGALSDVDTELAQSILFNTTVIGSENKELLQNKKTLTDIINTLGNMKNRINEVNSAVEQMTPDAYENFVKIIEKLNKMGLTKEVDKLLAEMPQMTKDMKDLFKDLNIDPKNNIEYMKFFETIDKIISLGEKKGIDLGPLKDSLLGLKEVNNYVFNIKEVNDYKESLNQLINATKDSMNMMDDVFKTAFDEDEYKLDDILALVSKYPELAGQYEVVNGKIQLQHEGIVNLLKEQQNVYEKQVDTILEGVQANEKQARASYNLMQLTKEGYNQGITSAKQLIKSISNGSDELYSKFGQDYKDFINSLDKELVVEVILEYSQMSIPELVFEGNRAQRNYEQAKSITSMVQETKKLNIFEQKTNELMKDRDALAKKVSKAQKKITDETDKYNKAIAKLDKDYTKLQKKMRELDKDEMLNKQIYLWNLADNEVKAFNNDLEMTKDLFNEINEFDFAAKDLNLDSQLTTTIEKGQKLREIFDELAAYQPQNEKDAEELAQRIEKIGSDLIANLKAARDLQKSIKDNALDSITGQTDFNEKYLSDYDIVTSSNEKQLKDGFSSATGNKLALDYLFIMPEESELDKKKKENEALLEEERKYREEINKVVLDALEKQRQAQHDAYLENKKELEEEMAENRKSKDDMMAEWPETLETLNKEFEDLNATLTRMNELLAALEQGKTSLDIFSFIGEDGKLVNDLSKMDETMRNIIAQNPQLEPLIENFAKLFSSNEADKEWASSHLIDALSIASDPMTAKGLEELNTQLQDAYNLNDPQKIADIKTATKSFFEAAIGSTTYESSLQAIKNLEQPMLDTFIAFMEQKFDPTVGDAIADVAEGKKVPIGADFDSEGMERQVAKAVEDIAGAYKVKVGVEVVPTDEGTTTTPNTPTTKNNNMSWSQTQSVSDAMYNQRSTGSKVGGGITSILFGSAVFGTGAGWSDPVKTKIGDKEYNFKIQKGTGLITRGTGWFGAGLPVTFDSLTDTEKEAFIKGLAKKLGITESDFRRQYLSGFATGTDSTPKGPILVGEEDPELAIFPDGTQKILGQSGPELVDIPQGSKIYNAQDTKEVLKYTGSKINGTKLSKFATGTTNNESLYDGIDKLISMIDTLLLQDKLLKAEQYELNDKLNQLLDLNTQSILKQQQEEDWLSMSFDKLTEAINMLFETQSVTNDKGEIELLGEEDSKSKIQSIVDTYLTEKQNIEGNIISFNTQPNTQLLNDTSNLLNITYDTDKKKLETPIIVEVDPDMKAIANTSKQFGLLMTNLITMTNNASLQINSMISAVISNMATMATSAVNTVNAAAQAAQTAQNVMSSTSTTAPLSGSSTNIGGYNINKTVYDWMMKAAQEVGIDPAYLFTLVAKESSFTPKSGYPDGSGGRMSYGYTALNSGGALPGIMKQLDGMGYNGANAKGDTYENILGGALHLKQLMDQYGTKEGYRRYNGSGPKAEEYAADALKKLNIFLDSLKMYASGVRNIHEDTNALVGEQGPEIVQYKDGHKELRGINGPEMMFLPAGSSVVNANQTRGYLQEQDIGETSNTIAQEASVASPIPYEAPEGVTTKGIADVALAYKDKVRYVWGAANIDSGVADCSGFVSNCLNKVLEGGFSRTDTRGFAKTGNEVSSGDIRRNDVLVFRNTTKTGGISHVGIALGNNQMIHLGTEGQPAKIADLNSYWMDRLATVRRIPGAGSGGSNVSNLIDGMSSNLGTGKPYAQEEAEKQQAINSVDRDIVTEKAFSGVADLISEYYKYDQGTEAFQTALANVRTANQIPPFYKIPKGTRISLPKTPDKNNFINAFEDGGTTKKDQYALYGEKGVELGIFADGTQRLLGKNGPEVGFIPNGTMIMNHKQTKEILKTNGGSYVKGYDGGSGGAIVDTKELVKTQEEATKTTEKNTEAINTLSKEIVNAKQTLGTFYQSSREGIEQRNVIENELRNNPSKAGMTAEWEIVKDMLDTLDQLAREQGLSDSAELLQGTYVSPSGEIKNNRDALINQDLIDMVNRYENSIESFVKKFSFDSNKLTKAIIDAGDAIDNLTKKYSMTEFEKILRNDYNKRAKEYNTNIEKIMGYEGASKGTNSYLDAQMRMSDTDFSEYMSNKDLYGQLVGPEGLVESYKKLTDLDKKRLQTAILRNEALRDKYDIQEDLMTKQDIEAGKQIIANNNGVNPLTDKDYRDQQLEGKRREDYKMLNYDYMLTKERQEETLRLLEAQRVELLKMVESGAYDEKTMQKYNDVLKKIKETTEDLADTMMAMYEATTKFVYGDDLEKIDKRMAKVQKQLQNYNSVRQEDMLNVMQYMKQQLQYTEGQAKTLEKVIEAQKELQSQYRVGSSEWVKAQEDLEKYQDALEDANQQIAEQQRSLIEQSFGVFEKVLDRIQRRIDSINQIDDIKEFTNTIHDLQLELNSINGLIDMSAIYKKADLSQAQNQIKSLITTQNDIINLVGSIDDMEKRIRNMPKETQDDREIIAATIMQFVGNAKSQIEQLEKYQSALKDKLGKVTREYAAQTKAYDDLIKQKEKELDDLDERNKKEEQYNDMIKLRMQLLRAMDETEHRYITGRGTVEYRADIDKVNDIRAQISEKGSADQKDAEKQALQDEINKLKEEQAEKAREYELQINLIQAQIEESQMAIDILSKIPDMLGEWSEYVFGMTDTELAKLEESIIGFNNGVTAFDAANLAAFGLDGYLHQTLQAFQDRGIETFDFFNTTVRDTMEATGKTLDEVLRGTGQSIYEAIQTEHIKRMEDNDKLFEKASTFFDNMINKIAEQLNIVKSEQNRFFEEVETKIAETTSKPYQDTKAADTTPPAPSSTPSTPSTPSAPTTPAAPQTKPGSTYTVKAGDKLWNIVKSHYGLKDDLAIAKRVNEVVSANQPNSQLNKDTLSAHGIKAADGIKGDMIYPGDKIFLPQFNTGGYTGNWADANGRLAILDKKELVLNADDTDKFLEGIKIQRDTQLQESRLLPLFASLLSRANSGNQNGNSRPIIIEKLELPDVTQPQEFVRDLNTFLNSMENKQG